MYDRTYINTKIKEFLKLEKMQTITIERTLLPENKIDALLTDFPFLSVKIVGDEWLISKPN